MRTFFPFFAFLAAACTTVARAGEPSDQIRQTSEKILAVVQDPALAGPANAHVREKKIRQTVDERFDWTSMARGALGKHWRDLTAEQRAEFTALFGDLIEKTYMTRLESYSGEKITYKGDSTDGKYGTVDVVIVTLKGADIPVTYRVLKRGAFWFVYDVSIEGVSLVNNYRSQIGTILDTKPYGDLIAKLKEKIAAATADSANGAKAGKQ